jgi:hypothetical protein
MSVFKKLGEGIADLSELNVQTFCGDITAVIDKSTSSNVIDWTKLLKDAKTSGKVKLIAAARIKFDGDADTYFAEDISADMLEAHLTAVEAGQNVREGLVAMFKDILEIG